MPLVASQSPVAICVKEAGDTNAGILLFRIKHHMGLRGGVVRAGKRWVANPHSYWSEDAGLSAKQTKRAFDILRDLGLIKTRVFMFRNVRTLHVRISELEERVDSAKSCHADFGTAALGTVTNVPEGAFLSYAEVLSGDLSGDFLHSVQKYNMCAKGFSESEQPICKVDEYPSGSGTQSLSPKPKTLLKENPTALDRSVAACLHSNLCAESLVAKGKFTQMQLLAIWYATESKAHPDYRFHNTYRKLKLVAALGKKLGPNAPLIIEKVVSEWGDYRRYLISAVNALSAPLLPDAGYAMTGAKHMLKWHTLQIEIAEERAKKEAAISNLKPVKKLPGSGPLAFVTKADPPVTIEEFLKICEDIDFDDVS